MKNRFVKIKRHSLIQGAQRQMIHITNASERRRKNPNKNNTNTNDNENEMLSRICSSKNLLNLFDSAMCYSTMWLFFELKSHWLNLDRTAYVIYVSYGKIRLIQIASFRMPPDTAMSNQHSALSLSLFICYLYTTRLHKFSIYRAIFKYALYTYYHFLTRMPFELK